MAEAAGAARLPLSDLRVVDCATLIAGPACARYLADFGADVVKVERPGGGDTARQLGWPDPGDPDGTALWWRLEGRNKRSVVLDLKSADGRDAMLALCRSAHVLVENFRPGTLERLGLGPDVLWATNPRLVVTRVTGFGQDGPYASRPGFATVAEAMSGFAAINGQPDGPPLLPPIALTDEVAGLVAAFGTMVALHSGVGQVVDVSLLESLFQLMGPLVAAWQLLGFQQPRLGSGLPYSVPRGTYRTADDRWVAVSGSADNVSRRILELVGASDDPRFATPLSRIEHRDEVDAVVGAWVGGRTLDEVLDAFAAADAACGPVLSMADIVADPHYRARGAVTVLDGVPMQGLVARLSATPGALRWAGRPLGADTAEVLAELARAGRAGDPAPGRAAP